jgi:hypothetical protein
MDLDKRENAAVSGAASTPPRTTSGRTLWMLIGATFAAPAGKLLFEQDDALISLLRSSAIGAIVGGVSYELFALFVQPAKWFQFSWFRFNARDLFWATALVGALLGWWLHMDRTQKKHDADWQAISEWVFATTGEILRQDEIGPYLKRPGGHRSKARLPMEPNQRSEERELP